MLIKLEIENFCSIRDPLVIDMTVPAKTPVDPRFAQIPDEDGLRIKKVLCLFGANASGKTTILRALAFLRMFVKESFDICKVGKGVYASCFDVLEGDCGRTRFAIEFFVAEPFRDEFSRYQYELIISQVEPQSFVQSEVLNAALPGQKYKCLFERFRDGDAYRVNASDEFEISADDPRTKARSNVSLISNLIQFDHQPAKKFADIFKASFLTNIAFNKVSIEPDKITDFFEENEDIKEEFRRIIRKIDVGIEDFHIVEHDGQKLPFFRHHGLSAENPLYFQSQGTQNFYGLFPLLAWGKLNNATAVVDELDSDLHPHLVSEIIRWFQRNDESCEFSQIITTLNHPSVLHQLEKEEVGLVSKGEDGNTSFKSLGDFEGLRRDTNLYKKYMGGAFGALPQYG